MNKKLTAKTQKIVSKTENIASVFSNVITVHPDDDTSAKKKGSIYATFDITSASELEQPVVTNIIRDVLHDSYYQSDNISPIQSLEKAIVDVKNKLVNLNGVKETGAKGNLEFNMIAGVLWGNVLYIVQQGKGNSFITREGTTKPISVITESNFSAASGVVKNEDVIVLATETFAEKFLPKKLFEASPQEFEQLEPKDSCLMLKFAIETSFAEEDQIDFGIPHKKRKKMPKLMKSFKTTFTRKPKIKKEEQINTLTPNLPRRRLKNSKPKSKDKRLLSKVAIPLVGILFIGSLGYSIIKQRNTSGDTPEEQISPIQAEINETPEEKPSEEEIDETVEKVEAEVFYDLKIANEEANPTEIAVTNDEIVVTDNTKGTIYVSDIATAKFVAEETTYPSIRNITTTEDKITFSDETGYKVYDTTTKTTTESYELETGDVLETYLGFIYEIKNDTLTKYTKSDGTLSGSTWAQAPEFANAKDMAISISIYILKSDNSIAKYTSGTKGEFTISGWEKDFKNPIQLVTDLDLENIYIADKGNQSIVILDKAGNFQKQLGYDAWNDIRSIAVTTTEDTLLVLSGSKVYKVSLE